MLNWLGKITVAVPWLVFQEYDDPSDIATVIPLHWRWVPPILQSFLKYQSTCMFPHLLMVQKSGKPTSWYGKYLIIYRVSYMLGGQPSTVSIVAMFLLKLADLGVDGFLVLDVSLSPKHLRKQSATDGTYGSKYWWNQGLAAWFRAKSTTPFVRGVK